MLETVKAFHNIPVELKMQMAPKHLNPANSNLKQGYFPFVPGDVSNKEFFSMNRPLSDIPDWERKGTALYENTPWIKHGENIE